MSRFLGRLSRTPSSHSIKSQASADLPPKTSEILTKPAPGCTPKPIEPLSAEQERKLADLEKYIRQVVAEDPPKEDYKKWEDKWLNEHNLYQRYLRAAKGDLENAKKRIKSTLEWRRDFLRRSSLPVAYRARENQASRSSPASTTMAGH